ncbi:hypothetical protein ACFL01_01105 [Planctomycetota bacterium]
MCIQIHRLAYVAALVAVLAAVCVPARAGEEAVEEKAEPARVPRTHESYRILYRLASEGLITSRPGSDFKEGRLFTHAEMAAFTAEALSNVREHSITLSIRQCDDLEKLLQGFRTVILVEAVAASFPPEEVIPPRHWTYTVMYRLATGKLITSQTPFTFKGGRLFSRADMVDFIGEALGKVRDGTVRLTTAQAEDLQRLIDEFRAELLIAGIDTTLPPEGELAKAKEKKVPFVLNFTNTARIGFQEGKDNDTYSDRTELEITGDFYRIGVSTSMDGTIGLGDDEKETDEKYLEFFGDMGDFRRGNIRLGDVSNVSTGEGLIVGAIDVEGASGTIGYRDAFDVAATYGENDEGDAFLVASAAFMLPPGINAGVAYVTSNPEDTANKDDPEYDDSIIGGHLSYSLSRFDFFVEYADKVDRGQGTYASLAWRIRDGVELACERRDYKRFAYSYNNPPVYTGISGGDDEDEVGYKADLKVAMINWLDLEAIWDTAETHGGHNTRHDYFLQGTIDLPKDVELTLSWEYEDGSDGISKVGTARTGWDHDSGFGVSVDYSIDIDPEDLRTQSLRLSLDHSFFNDKLSAGAGTGIRWEEHKNVQNNLDVSLDWTVSEHHSLSATYTLTEEREHEGDLTWIFRY